MLVPILALADSAKALVANASGDVQRVRSLWQASMVITGGLMSAWIALVPAFPSFAETLAADEETVRWAVTAFYSFPTCSSPSTPSPTASSMEGKTKYLAYQSLLTNGTVYVAAFLLYVLGAWSRVMRLTLS